MKDGGFSLGGEQSGHVIFLDHGTTGDGTMTGLMLASRLAQTGRSLEDLAAVMKRLPQVLINVKGVDKSRVEANEAVQAEVRAAQAELDGLAGCSCASPAPSPWSGSWSRPRMPRRHRLWPSGWPTSSQGTWRSEARPPLVD